MIDSPVTQKPVSKFEFEYLHENSEKGKSLWDTDHGTCTGTRQKQFDKNLMLKISRNCHLRYFHHSFYGNQQHTIIQVTVGRYSTVPAYRTSAYLPNYRYSSSSCRTIPTYITVPYIRYLFTSSYRKEYLLLK